MSDLKLMFVIFLRIYVYFFNFFLPKTCFGWYFLPRTYVHTYMVRTYVRTYIHTLYGGGGLPRTYVHTSYGGVPREPLPQMYLDTDKKSLRSLGTKNRQNHELKQLFWSCFWRGVEIWISLFWRQDVRVLSLPYIVWREPHTLYASLNHVSCDGCRLIHCMHFCMDWGGSESR